MEDKEQNTSYLQKLNCWYFTLLKAGFVGFSFTG